MQSVTEQTNFVLVDRPRPHVALVTLNRPERMNSMAFDVMVPLKAVLEEIKTFHVTLKGPTTTPRKGDPWPNIESANVALRKGARVAIPR